MRLVPFFYKIIAVILVQMRAEASSLDYAECSRECALAKSGGLFCAERSVLPL